MCAELSPYILRKDYYYQAWCRKAGNVPEKSIKTQLKYTELVKSEWSIEFEKLMRNRLILGAYRYGKMGHGEIPYGKPEYDRIESIKQRLDRFQKTGNAEWLVDIANMALLIFEERVHAHFHFESIGEDNEYTYHDKIKKK